MARKFGLTTRRVPYRRLPLKIIKGRIEINFGMDNFCYVHTKNNRRVDLTEWMKKFDGKEVEIKVVRIGVIEERKVGVKGK